MGVQAICAAVPAHAAASSSSARARRIVRASQRPPALRPRRPRITRPPLAPLAPLAQPTHTTSAHTHYYTDSPLAHIDARIANLLDKTFIKESSLGSI